MFESKDKLAEQIGTFLDGLRASVDGRFACLIEPTRLVFERAEPGDEDSAHLRQLLLERSETLFRIPDNMATGGELPDVFEGWDKDEFFLAFVNRRIALVVACPDAERLRAAGMRPLRVLADRLFRYEPLYRLDPQGRGLFLGRPRLDIIVVGKAHGEPANENR